jgi:excisionase family DNA binding protein
MQSKFEAEDVRPIVSDSRGAAKMLKVSVRTVQAMAQRGDLPHWRAGNVVRFPIEQLKEHILGGK